MADFNKPALTSTKTNFPGEIRDLAASAIIMDEAGYGYTDTNRPVGAKKINAIGQIKFWSGADFLGQLFPQGTVLSGTGTTKAGATAIPAAGLIGIKIGTSVGQTAFRLPDGIEANDCFFVAVWNTTTSGAAALIFPPNDGTLNNSSSSSVSVAVGKGALFFRIQDDEWGSVVGA